MGSGTMAMFMGIPIGIVFGGIGAVIIIFIPGGYVDGGGKYPGTPARGKLRRDDRDVYEDPDPVEEPEDGIIPGIGICMGIFIIDPGGMLPGPDCPY
jgi:hypothetical protein